MTRSVRRTEHGARSRHGLRRLVPILSALTSALLSAEPQAPPVGTGPASGVLPAGTPIAAAEKPGPRIVRVQPTLYLRVLKETEVPLPGRAVDLAVGGCGRYLAIRIEGSTELIVFDAETSAFTGAIRLPAADALFTSGGDRVVSYDRRGDTLQMWSLVDSSRTGACTNPLGGLITDLAMGCCSRDRVAARAISGDRTGAFHGQVSLGAVGLEDCAARWTIRGPSDSGWRPDFAARLRASPGFALLVSWSPESSPSGVEAFEDSGGGYRRRYLHENAGVIIPTDRRRIFGSKGDVFSTSVERVGFVRGYVLAPSSDGDHAIGVNNLGDLTLFDADALAAEARMGGFPRAIFEEPHRFVERWTSSPLTPEKRLVCDMRIGRCVFLRLDDRVLVIRSYETLSVARGRAR